MPKFNFQPSTIQVVAIVFLLFLLVLSIAHMRRHFFDWSMKGATFGLFFGFVLALILEGFLLVSGKTVLIGFLGWKNAPKPLQNVLEAGRTELTKVLGVNDCR